MISNPFPPKWLYMLIYNGVILIRVVLSSSHPDIASHGHEHLYKLRWGPNGTHNVSSDELHDVQDEVTGCTVCVQNGI